MSGTHRDLHSFPTRRSSDLLQASGDYSGGTVVSAGTLRLAANAAAGTNSITLNGNTLDIVVGSLVDNNVSVGNNASRSEEHTSELQSHHDLVCRLLLEKKKN